MMLKSSSHADSCLFSAARNQKLLLGAAASREMETDTMLMSHNAIDAGTTDANE